MRPRAAPATTAAAVLALCVFAAAAGPATHEAHEAHSAASSWLDIISQYARATGAGREPASWPPRPFPVQLPVGEGGRVTTLPVLVLPLPVPVYVPREECSTGATAERIRAEGHLEAHRSPSLYPVERPTDFDLPRVAVSSQKLIEEFRRQQPSAPHLPPAVLSRSRRAAVPPPQETRVEPPPPLPAVARPSYPSAAPLQFDRSLFLRARLTVPRADYTETYAVRWDASGRARVDLHDGDTVTLRTPLAGDRVRRVAVSVDRSGERDVRICAISEDRVGPADGLPPGVPDTASFSFAGLANGAGVPVERWTRSVTPGAGEGGAARGERLTFRHELRVTRRTDGLAVPLRYHVEVDSSVLGPACDSYEHIYEEVRAQEHEPAVFEMDLGTECDVREEMDAAEPEHAARLEPLREFTLPMRDPRHEDALRRFKTEFERKYVDEKEEAVRTNLFVQNRRFISSANRLDAPFKCGVNFLADRLDGELEQLLGVQYDSDEGNIHPDPFPYAEQGRSELGAKLPREFDWRKRGGVTPVRYQGSCSSCWAFAVTGAVEGAHFVRTRRLVSLSEQCLVDCGFPYGAHGCNGTWPVHAYEYVRERGLPALDEYTPYQDKVTPCRESIVKPVTHISGFVDVPPRNVEALKVSIRKNGPVVVVIDSRPKSFVFYTKGVIEDQRCIKGPKNKLNHAVLAVGWGDRRGQSHFIMKNSYSDRWGDEGYVRMDAASNACGHQTVPSFPELRLRDVDRALGRPAPAAPGDDDYEDDDSGLQ